MDIHFTVLTKEGPEQKLSILLQGTGWRRCREPKTARNKSSPWLYTRFRSAPELVRNNNNNDYDRTATSATAKIKKKWSYLGARRLGVTTKQSQRKRRRPCCQKTAVQAVSYPRQTHHRRWCPADRLLSEPRGIPHPHRLIQRRRHDQVVLNARRAAATTKEKDLAHRGERGGSVAPVHTHRLSSRRSCRCLGSLAIGARGATSLDTGLGLRSESTSAVQVPHGKFGQRVHAWRRAAPSRPRRSYRRFGNSDTTIGSQVDALSTTSVGVRQVRRAKHHY